MYNNYARKLAEHYKVSIDEVKKWGIVKYYKACVDREFADDNRRKEELS